MGRMSDPADATPSPRRAFGTAPALAGRPPASAARDWYVHEWMLLAFAAGMLLLIYFVAEHDRDYERAEIVRDAALVEQAFTRRLEADQQFIDRIALDLGANRMSNQEFEQVAGKRALESGYLGEILRVTPEQQIVQYAPDSHSPDAVSRNRAPFAERVAMTSLARQSGRGVFSQPYLDDADRFRIEYAAPIVTPQGFAGTVNVVIPFDRLLEKSSPDWARRTYRAIVSDVNGKGMSNTEATYIESGIVKHTLPLSLPWHDLQLTLIGARLSGMLPNLTLSTAVLALTGLMVWTSMGLRKQWRMRRLAEGERDRAYAQSLADLRVVNERVATVLDAVDVAIYVSELDGHRLLYVNPHLLATFAGVEVADDVRQIEAAFIEAPSIRFPATQLLTGEGEPGNVCSAELECHDHRHFQTHTRAVRWIDGRIARLTTLTDISKRVNAERLREAQQDALMRTSRLMSVGEMASTLAHEINQPLAAIANYVSGCIRRLRNDGHADPAVIQAMEKADAQVTRAGAIIGRVREFVRTREPQRQALDLNALVEDVARLAQSDDEHRSLRCALHLTGGLPAVFADRIMIEQVLLNFVRNAREAMQHLPAADRVVDIRTARIDATHAVVEVADRGVGISADTARQLFSPFFSTKRDGMGMGLNICRSLIEYHEGTLTFGDNVPCGAVFRFTLPFVLPPAGPATRQPDLPPTRGNAAATPDEHDNA